MEWICQLGDGRMLGRQDAMLVRVNTGYPYPDIPASQYEMLADLFDMYCLGWSQARVEKQFAQIIRKFNNIFDSAGKDELNGQDVINSLVVGKKKCGAKCLYHDSGYGVYRVSDLGSLALMSLGDFNFIGHEVTMRQLKPPVYLVIPAGKEDKFRGILDMPAGDVNTDEIPNQFMFEGYVNAAVLTQSVFNGLVGRTSKYYQQNIPRIIFAVFPRLGMEGYVDKFCEVLNHLGYSDISWSSFGEMRADDILEYYGRDVKDTVLEVIAKAKLMEFAFLCDNVMKWSKFRRVKRDGDLVGLRDKELVSALEMSFKHIRKPTEYLNTAFWQAGFQYKTAAGVVAFSLRTAFGEDLAEFVARNMMSRTPTTNCDYTQTAAAMCGVSMGTLSKFILLQSEDFRKVGLSHIYSNIQYCGDVTSCVVLLCYHSNVTWSDESKRVARIKMLEWMPEILYENFDFDKFKASYPVDVKAFVLEKLCHYAQSVHSTKGLLSLWKALRENTIKTEYNRYNHLLVVQW